MPATAATYGSAEHHSQFEQFLNVAKVRQLALSWSTDRVHACMPFPVGQLRDLVRRIRDHFLEDGKKPSIGELPSVPSQSPGQLRKSIRGPSRCGSQQ
ncbi:hypothetical protein ABHI18_008902 [Aspergillus niger]